MDYGDFELKSRAEIIELTKNRAWRKKVFSRSLDSFKVKTLIDNATVELTIIKGGSYRGETIYNCGIVVNGKTINVKKYDGVHNIEKLVIQWLRRYDIDNVTIYIINDR